MFYNFIKNTYEPIKNYNTIKYYDTKFKGVFTYIKTKNISYLIFSRTFIESKIDNFNDMINLKNILGITDTEFKNNLFIKTSKNNLFIRTSEENYIFPIICMSCNIEFILQILNYCFDEKPYLLLNNQIVCKVMTYVSVSNKIENLSLIFNYLIYEKNFKFTKQQYSDIIKNIIWYGEKKHHEYDKIIYELINLGGTISGYSIYTDYIDRLKIINNDLK